MASVVEPAAEVYWDAVGTIYDENGATEIEPQTIEEWDGIRNAAYVVAESGNLLMMSSRAKDGDLLTVTNKLKHFDTPYKVAFVGHATKW